MAKKTLLMMLVLAFLFSGVRHDVYGQNEKNNDKPNKKAGIDITPYITPTEHPDASPTPSEATPTPTPTGYQSPTPTNTPPVIGGNNDRGRRDREREENEARNRRDNNDEELSPANTEPVPPVADHAEAFLDTTESEENAFKEDKKFPQIIPGAAAQSLAGFKINYYLSANIDPVTNMNLLLASIFFILSGILLLRISPKPQDQSQFSWEAKAL